MICENCGKTITQKEDTIISFKNGKDISIVCRECSTYYGTCGMCANLGPCAFTDDPDPMPQMVVIQQTQQTPMGVMTVQKQVPNPERIKKFCLDGKCSCVDESDPEHPLCCRHSGCATCTNYREKEQPNFVEDFSQENTNEN